MSGSVMSTDPYADLSASLSANLSVGLSDVSLSIMIIGAIVLAGATVMMTAIPDWRMPLRRRRSRSEPGTTVIEPVAQRRVVTGRKPTLPPVGDPLPVRPPTAAPAPGQALALADGRRPTMADIQRAEAVIDEYLASDPQMLASTLAAWIAADDRNRRQP
jgi:hypothetical protein